MRDPQFDCAPVTTGLSAGPSANTAGRSIYLAKDYSSFRQVMLDRLIQLLPSWNAISEADIGVMMAS